MELSWCARRVLATALPVCVLRRVRPSRPSTFGDLLTTRDGDMTTALQQQAANQTAKTTLAAGASPLLQCHLRPVVQLLTVHKALPPLAAASPPPTAARRAREKLYRICGNCNAAANRTNFTVICNGLMRRLRCCLYFIGTTPRAQLRLTTIWPPLAPLRVPHLLEKTRRGRVRRGRQGESQNTLL